MSIIDATDRFPGDRKRSQRWMSRRFPKSVIDLLSIRAKRKWTAEGARAFYCPAMKGLPFVAPKELGGNVCAGVGSYHWWSDEPTELGHGDHNRGRVYARLLIRAIEEDRPLQNPRASRGFSAPWFLEKIFEAMIEDAVRRRTKGGKRSRTALTPTMDGFLRELSLRICQVGDRTSPVT